MEALLVHRPQVEKGRPERTWLAFVACAVALVFATPAGAQTLDSRPPGTPQQDSPRRARTLRPERSHETTRDAKRDDADGLDGKFFAEGEVDVGLVEARIRDLSSKVRELNDLLQRQREATAPIRFAPRPMRVTLLERHRPPPVPKTYGEALAVVARDRARAIRILFDDAEERKHLAIDPDPAEVQRLLEPIDGWLGVPGTPAQRAYAHLQALVYATLLEARVKIECPEPLPVVYKLLRDLHIDRRALTEHLRRSFLLDHAARGPNLGAVLAATAAAYPEPSGMRDFLTWLADSVGADLKDELLAQAAYPYRGDPGGQFDAAAENAINDNGAVLKLQVDLQRMLVEAKALASERGADETTAGAWQHRLLRAERELDHLLRAADSEREAVMTLVRRMPIEKRETAVMEPALDSLSIEPPEAVASDDLTTQH